MAQIQPTFNNVLNMTYSLTLAEQVQLVREVQNNFFSQVTDEHYTTPQTLKMRLRKSHEQAISGETLSSEKSHQMMNEFIHTRISQNL